MNRLLIEIKVAAEQAPRLYFAPLVGAFNAVRREVRNLNKSHAVARHVSSTRTASPKAKD